jgi:hypothetical protein
MTDLTEAKRLVEAAREQAMTLSPMGALPNLIGWYLDNGFDLIAEHEAALQEIEALREGLAGIAEFSPGVTHGWADAVRHKARALLGDWS